MATRQMGLFEVTTSMAKEVVSSVTLAENHAEQYVTEGERVHAREDFLAGWDAVGAGGVDMDKERICHNDGKYSDPDDKAAARGDFEAGWRARAKWNEQNRT